MNRVALRMRERRWMPSIRVTVLLTIGFFNLSLGASPGLTVSLKHGDAAEQQTQTQLERLLLQYDLTPWIFTTSIVIDEDAIPHSHPINIHPRTGALVLCPTS